MARMGLLPDKSSGSSERQRCALKRLMDNIFYRLAPIYIKEMKGATAKDGLSSVRGISNEKELKSIPLYIKIAEVCFSKTIIVFLIAVNDNREGLIS